MDNLLIRRCSSLGCLGVIEKSIDRGLSEEDATVATDVLEEEGIDAFFQFIREQTKGRVDEDLFWKAPVVDLGALPGRRIFYNLSGRLNWELLLEGSPLLHIKVGQQPFVMTHYPLFTLNRAQTFLSPNYQLYDIGACREHTKGTININSTPTGLVPLPMETLFAPNSEIQIRLRDTDKLAVEPGDQLCVTIPGYRIVNS